MPVLISPTTVRSAEYGYMTGAVASLSDFPASVDSMAAALQNQELAEAFWSDGAPYAGRIALTPDPATASGLAWTSAKGAEVNVTAGTLAEIDIEVDSQPPISLVVPIDQGMAGATESTPAARRSPRGPGPVRPHLSRP